MWVIVFMNIEWENCVKLLDNNRKKNGGKSLPWISHYNEIRVTNDIFSAISCEIVVLKTVKVLDHNILNYFWIFDQQERF